jgi:hypothetical protein
MICKHKGFYADECNNCKDRFACLTQKPSMAIVTDIQVGGAMMCGSLEEACKEIKRGGSIKIHFSILLPNGAQRTITIRDEDDRTVVYGNLWEALPDFLDYAKEVKEL